MLANSNSFGLPAPSNLFAVKIVKKKMNMNYKIGKVVS